MPNDIYEDAQKDVRLKALLVIECIATNEWGLVDTRINKLWGIVHNFCHVAIGQCENPHTEWRKELDDTFKAMHKAGEF